MKTIIPPIAKLFIIITFSLSTIQFCKAQLVLSNWQIDSDSLSFDINGTIPSHSAGSILPGMILIGTDNAMGDWITRNTSPSISPIVTSIGSNDVTYSFFVQNYDQDSGDYLYLYNSLTDSSTLNVGGSVNIHVSYTETGIFNPSNINVNDLVFVSGVGNGVDLINLPNKLAHTVQSVPEPGVFSFIVIGCMYPMLRRRK